MLSKSILTYSTGSFASLLLEIQPVWGKNETQGLHYVDILLRVQVIQVLPIQLGSLGQEFFFAG